MPLDKTHNNFPTAHLEKIKPKTAEARKIRLLNQTLLRKGQLSNTGQ
jgi:hypothetical protein